jgi:hypothetical protein
MGVWSVGRCGLWGIHSTIYPYPWEEDLSTTTTIITIIGKV